MYFKKVKSDIIECDSNSSCTKKYQDHIPCSFAYKTVCSDNTFSKKVVLYREKDDVYNFIKSILNEYNYCTKVIKNHFNKNLIVSAKEEERFEMNNIYWNCNKLFDVSGNKVKDHCCITKNKRGAAH